MTLKRASFFWVFILCAVILTGCSGGGEVEALRDEVKINEIMSNNKYYAPLADGYCYDWMEFHNSSDHEVNLKGAMISDNTKTLDKWKVPVDCMIEPNGYVLIYFSGLNKVDEYGNIHANFKLSSKGETIVFSNQNGDVIQQINLPSCETKNISYGLNNSVSQSDADEYFFFSEPSPLAANKGYFSTDINSLKFPESGIVINEYMTKNTYTVYDSNNQYSDWIELYNSSTFDVSLSGYSLTDKADGKGKWFFPDDTVIKAGEYLIVFCSDMLAADPAELHADFNLSAGDVITLYSIAGKTVDSVKVIELNPNVSCGRALDGSGFKLFASPTPGRENRTYAYETVTNLTAAPYSSLYISEAMCVSVSSSADYKNDFIEIHNAASQAVSLKDYGLSKDAGEAAFKFPDIKLQPDEYIVVYCTGKNYSKVGKTLQAAFKLNQGGEEVFLFDAGGHVIDSMNTGKQTLGHSSGRLSTEKNVIYVFGAPTPGESNDKSKTYLGYAPLPQLSSEGGYVKKGTRVSISVPEGCSVYYTTTGKDPSSSAAKYSSDIPINKTTVIKAISTKKGYLTSQIVVGTYLVEKEHSIPVVSVASDPDGLFSAYNGIMSGFVGGLVSGEPNYKSTEERKVTFEYFVDGQKAVSFYCRMRLFGETSRKEPQKGLALLMSEDCGINEVYYPFFGDLTVDVFSSMVLRPSGQDWRRTHMRDELCAALSRDMNLDHMEFQPVALYINGEYWGLYYLREKLNEDYLVHKYGMTKGKIDIVKWERIRQAGSRNDYLDLCEYCSTHDLTVQKNYDYVCSKVDIDSLIDWWVFETYVANNDTGNIRCYRDQNDGKWKWMLFDLDNAFYLTTYENNYIKQYMLGSTHGLSRCNNSIPKNLLKNKDFRDKFITAYCRHMKTTFEPEHVISVMESISDMIKDEMPRQTARWKQPTDSYWNYNKTIIRMIAKKKPEMAKQQLMEAFHLTEKQFQKYYDAA